MTLNCYGIVAGNFCVHVCVSLSKPWKIRHEKLHPQDQISEFVVLETRNNESFRSASFCLLHIDIFLSITPSSVVMKY